MSGNERCPPSSGLPVELFRRTAELLPRLHGLGSLCNNCDTVDDWLLLFRVASRLQRPLAELRVDDFRLPPAELFNVVSVRAVQRACSPAVAPQLRALTLHRAWCPTDDDPPFTLRKTYAALAQLPQLTQLECSSLLWVELVERQPHAALYDQLLSLSICIVTRLGPLCHALCSSGMAQLRVLRLYGWLQSDDAVAPTAAQQWAALWPALPRLETLALHFGSVPLISAILPRLFPADRSAIAQVQVTLSLRTRIGGRIENPSCAAVKRILSHCPQLRLELQLVSLPLSDTRESWRSWMERVWEQWYWSALPRTTYTRGWLWRH